METNQIITLANNEKYLIIAKANKDNIDYYYVAELNSEVTDIKDNYKIVTINTRDSRQYMDEVLGEKKLKAILPLFIS